MSFFDGHLQGELVNRLSQDVAEFKVVQSFTQSIAHIQTFSYPSMSVKMLILGIQSNDTNYWNFYSVISPLFFSYYFDFTHNAIGLFSNECVWLNFEKNV
jgi:hypothetical protein